MKNVNIENLNLGELISLRTVLLEMLDDETKGYLNLADKPDEYTERHIMIEERIMKVEDHILNYK